MLKGTTQGTSLWSFMKIGPVVLEKKSFKAIEDRRTDAGQVLGMNDNHIFMSKCYKIIYFLLKQSHTSNKLIFIICETNMATIVRRKCPPKVTFEYIFNNYHLHILNHFNSLTLYTTCFQPPSYRWGYCEIAFFIIITFWLELYIFRNI